MPYIKEHKTVQVKTTTEIQGNKETNGDARNVKTKS